MKFKQILKHAIEKGWKKERLEMKYLKWWHSKKIPSDYPTSILEGNKVAHYYFYYESFNVLKVNLEEIEELKELCRVLWERDCKEDWEKKWHESQARVHFKMLIDLNSWKERKEYIETNFKK